MRLETEFRLCLQRQMLEWALHNSADDVAPPPVSNGQFAIAPSVWVKLLLLPEAFCSDEALLLCQYSDSQWLAWIPDYGEILLDRGQFDPLV